MRRSILACGLLLAFAGMSTAVAAAAGAVGVSTDTDTTSTTSTTTAASTSNRAGGRSAWYWRKHLEHYRAGAQHWLTVIRGRPVHQHSSSRSLASSPDAAHLRELAKLWHRREHRVWHRATHPPLLRDWNCIHHYEGSWTDHGSPYWGGLQMDYSFQSTYGSWLLRHKGTADHWTSYEQIWVAVRAWRVRGFAPWPNTARDCGVY